ncbi:hypothetical protein [Stenotrophomonas sp. GD03657]|uniref:DUF7941 domain-family protein n=1 Tax=Stenotrophomonas sp. GD03657 TaxID=2975363 RepID=UPI0024474CAB|nr:hypothetical protein [Stenotrophomonas sp. GD03657]MDH2154213.1 hypothetical protein [Stenotrophomonas sp. GD03657]
MSLPYSGKAGLANLINKSNGTGYTADTVGHEAPVAHAGPNGENTKVLVWHVQKPEDKTEVFFNRLDLADVVVDLEGGYTPDTLFDLLTAINAERKLDIAVADLEEISPFPESGDVVLTAAASSLGYKGTVTVTLGSARQQRVAPQSFSAPSEPEASASDEPTADAPTADAGDAPSESDESQTPPAGDEEITEENTRPD